MLPIAAQFALGSKVIRKDQPDLPAMVVLSLTPSKRTPGALIIELACPVTRATETCLLEDKFVAVPGNWEDCPSRPYSNVQAHRSGAPITLEAARAADATRHQLGLKMEAAADRLFWTIEHLIPLDREYFAPHLARVQAEYQDAAAAWDRANDRAAAELSVSSVPSVAAE